MCTGHRARSAVPVHALVGCASYTGLQVLSQQGSRKRRFWKATFPGIRTQLLFKVDLLATSATQSAGNFSHSKSSADNFSHPKSTGGNSSHPKSTAANSSQPKSRLLPNSTIQLNMQAPDKYLVNATVSNSIFKDTAMQPRTTPAIPIPTERDLRKVIQRIRGVKTRRRR